MASEVVQPESLDRGRSFVGAYRREWLLQRALNRTLEAEEDMTLKAKGSLRGVAFLLEQPAEPEYKPEVVSLWRTTEW